jgi:hypothetical protein
MYRVSEWVYGDECDAPSIVSAMPFFKKVGFVSVLYRSMSVTVLVD